MARPAAFPPLTAPLKRALVGQVRALFHDQARGEKPVQRKADGLFGPDSAAWRVHGDVTSMMVGGVAALLLQMLHPGALAGVWDFSDFRQDMLGRLRRTARFIALTTYGGQAEATEAIARIRAVHDRVSGTLPDGTPYDANDPHLLNWVHVSESICFLEGWLRYVEPDMPAAEQDRYFAEVAVIAQMLGARDVPDSRATINAYIARTRPELRYDDRTRTVAKLLLDQPPTSRAAAPFQRLTLRAGVDLLPGWAKAMHGFPRTSLTTPLVRAGTGGIGRTIRWAFR
ncbi:oxygenase MpaB family protein [Stakelama saccharophila]|uniref:Oxygenase MpaB family protein n=1 Tax=Stakelama saccharophila TaxID=3075605 RepID=A0ABZ0B996_9SPHN|nr:oxygenase MpaB family protein [Stakelama sp. W311]WNO53686.1 oxygenase MpaB family protein [Stakelama sp. W311]